MMMTRTNNRTITTSGWTYYHVAIVACLLPVVDRVGSVMVRTDTINKEKYTMTGLMIDVMNGLVDQSWSTSRIIQSFTNVDASVPNNNDDEDDYQSAVKKSKPLKVIEGFLTDEQELKHFLDAFGDAASTIHAESASPNGVYTNRITTVGPAFVRRVLEAAASTDTMIPSNKKDECTRAWKDVLTPSKQDENIADVTTVFMRTITQGSTPIHHDRFWDDAGTLVQDYVGFVFLNDNHDASFTYLESDKTLKIPAKKGNLVIFDGSVPHHTVVQRGNIRMIGPFYVDPSMALVGMDIELETKIQRSTSQQDSAMSKQAIAGTVFAVLLTALLGVTVALLWNYFRSTRTQQDSLKHEDPYGTTLTVNDLKDGRVMVKKVTPEASGGDIVQKTVYPDKKTAAGHGFMSQV